jgi:hypothetical protein
MRRFSAIMCLLFAITACLSAQVDKGSVSGTVSDTTGAVISGVEVAATNVETGAVYSGQYPTWQQLQPVAAAGKDYAWV